MHTQDFVSKHQFVNSQCLKQGCVAFLFLHLSHSVGSRTITTYLAAIQFVSNTHGHHERICDFARLGYVILGIRRFQGNRFSRPRRNPIQVRHLNHIIDFIQHSRLQEQDRALCIAASLMAFFGLLRVSEYTCATPVAFEASFDLLVNDVSFSNGIATICIKSSKTDPFRQGVNIRLPSISNSRLCPVTALSAFLARRGYTPGPLFTFSNGRYLTRQDMHWLLSQITNGVNLNTHSFRIGGASAAASAGVSNSTIQVLGRWSSNAYLQYLRFSDRTITTLGLSISQSSNHTSWWQPV